MTALSAPLLDNVVATAVEQRAAFMLWASVPDVGPKALRSLLDSGHTLAGLWQSDPTWMAHQTWLSAKAQVGWLKRRAKTPVPHPDALTAYEASGIRLILWGEPAYPASLAQIYNPPAVLFVQGNVDSLTHEHNLAIVGTRKISDYGRQMTADIVAGLRDTPVQIVSGMAGGVDTVAHQTALDVGLPTVAVFGCGLDIVYPVGNKRLAQDILQAGGALVSEYPLGTEPFASQFPARNRIVVGLSRAVLLTQGPLKSGAMITARLASEEGRTVMTVPGPMTESGSQGPFHLLRQGATPVATADHIAEELFGSQTGSMAAGEIQQKLALTSTPLSKPTTDSRLLTMDPALRVLYHRLPEADISVERLAQSFDMPLSALMAQLTLLELDGWVTFLPGGRLQKQGQG